MRRSQRFVDNSKVRIKGYSLLKQVNGGADVFLLTLAPPVPSLQVEFISKWIVSRTLRPADGF